MTQDFPEYLTRRYHGKKHIDRIPFIVNKSVSDEAVSRGQMQKRVAPNEVFFGIAGLRALDLLSSAGRQSGQQYQHAVLFDVNHRQVKMTNVILQMIKEAETPEQFLASFEKNYQAMLRPPQSPKRKVDPAFIAAWGATDSRYQPNATADVLAYMQTRRQREDSFLQPDNFAHLKKILAEGKIHTAVMDLADDDRVGAVMSWMKNNHLQTGDVYVSTALRFINRAHHSDYWGRDATAQRRGVVDQLSSLLGGTGQILYSEPESGGQSFTLQAFEPENPGKLESFIAAYGSKDFYCDQCAHGSVRLILEAQTNMHDDESLLIEVRGGGRMTKGQLNILRHALREQGIARINLEQDGMTARSDPNPEDDYPITNDSAWRNIVDAVNKAIATPEYQAEVQETHRFSPAHL